MLATKSSTVALRTVEDSANLGSDHGYETGTQVRPVHTQPIKGHCGWLIYIKDNKYQSTDVCVITYIVIYQLCLDATTAATMVRLPKQLFHITSQHVFVFSNRQMSSTSDRTLI